MNIGALFSYWGMKGFDIERTLLHQSINSHESLVRLEHVRVKAPSMEASIVVTLTGNIGEVPRYCMKHANLCWVPWMSNNDLYVPPGDIFIFNATLRQLEEHLN